MTRTQQLIDFLTPKLVSGAITKGEMVSIITLIQMEELDKEEILRWLRIAFKTGRWSDYSAGTPYDQIEQILKKHGEFDEMTSDHVEGDVNTFDQTEGEIS